MLLQASCAAIGGRGVLIQGPPGCGKSSLLLALLDRGAVLVGDDGVDLICRAGRLYASPAPATRGLLEIRNLGLLTYPVLDEVPLALTIALSPAAPRFIDSAATLDLLGITLPHLQVWPESPVLALKVEAALVRYGTQ